MAKGFTLFELLVATAVIMLLTALTLPNFRAGQAQLSLERSAHKLAQDIRRAQEMAMSLKEFNSQVPAGYGIYIDETDLDQYILFADLDGNQAYSGENEKSETISLEQRIEINAPGSDLIVAFYPPEPTVIISPDTQSLSIIVKIVGQAKQKTVQINKAGLINVQ